MTQCSPKASSIVLASAFAPPPGNAAITKSFSLVSQSEAVAMPTSESNPQLLGGQFVKEASIYGGQSSMLPSDATAIAQGKAAMANFVPVATSGTAAVPFIHANPKAPMVALAYKQGNAVLSTASWSEVPRPASIDESRPMIFSGDAFVPTMAMVPRPKSFSAPH